MLLFKVLHAVSLLYRILTRCLQGIDSYALQVPSSPGVFLSVNMSSAGTIGGSFVFAPWAVNGNGLLLQGLYNDRVVEASQPWNSFDPKSPHVVSLIAVCMNSKLRSKPCELLANSLLSQLALFINSRISALALPKLGDSKGHISTRVTHIEVLEVWQKLSNAEAPANHIPKTKHVVLP